MRDGLSLYQNFAKRADRAAGRDDADGPDVPQLVHLLSRGCLGLAEKVGRGAGSDIGGRRRGNHITGTQGRSGHGPCLLLPCSFTSFSQQICVLSESRIDSTPQPLGAESAKTGTGETSKPAGIKNILKNWQKREKRVDNPVVGCYNDDTLRRYDKMALVPIRLINTRLISPIGGD